MPRLVNPPTTLRNRNRITNKYRLKIHKGDIDTDPFIPDEEDEKSRSNLAVAGVDQDDANVSPLLQSHHATSPNRCGGVFRGSAY